jgi:hypothetical protein
MTSDSNPRHELAMQVAVAVAAAAAGLQGPEVAAIATGLSPVALAGLERMSEVIRTRRTRHAAETLVDAADEFEARTHRDFEAFVEAAVSDAQHQELLARALLIAQDTAMRDKRRALGRALAAAADETGTRVDDELIFVRVLSDLDEPHVRLLRLLATTPSQPGSAQGDTPSAWFPSVIAATDPGLGETLWALLNVLERNGLAWVTTEVYRTPSGTTEPECAIRSSGRKLLVRLAEPEPDAPTAEMSDGATALDRL